MELLFLPLAIIGVGVLLVLLVVLLLFGVAVASVGRFQSENEDVIY